MPLQGEHLAFVGCGMMGEAMIRGLLRQKLVDPGQIVISHPRAERARELADSYGVGATTDNVEAAARATIVAITVKPQVLDEVLEDLASLERPPRMVMSIVAGARMARLATALGVDRVVRVMPNTPAQVGSGMSVWTATGATDELDRARARTMLRGFGAEEFVIHEEELDMATALSGTGPAYAFLFIEALIDAGVHLGFSRRVSSRLVLETMRGAVEFAAQAPEHLAKLRNQVTSPGGTSAEALYQLEKGRLRTVVSDAVWAAYRRCLQLGSTVSVQRNGRPLEDPPMAER